MMTMLKEKEADKYLREFLEQPSSERTAQAVGEICLAIGKGDVRGAVWQIIDRSMRAGFLHGYNTAVKEANAAAPPQSESDR